MHASIQAKLNIGQPGDKFEKEADQTAARVMAKPAAVQAESTASEDIQQMSEKEGEISTKNFVQHSLFDDENDVTNDMLNAKESSSAEASDENEVQAKVSDQSSSAKATEHKPAANFENKLNSAKCGGEKLPADTQTEMENRFGGKDFSKVRVHNDSASAEMNKEVKSKAFTNENHIFFNNGQYSKSESGKELLAHELTHTVQQGATEDKVQREIEDYQKTEDAESTKANTEEAFADELGDDINLDSVPITDESPSDRPDEEKDTEGTEELAGETKPDADRFEEAAPSIESSTKEVESKAEKPVDVEGILSEKPLKKEKKELSKKEIAGLEANAAFKRAEKVRPPKEPKEVKMPDLIMPVNSEGDAVASDPALVMKNQALGLMISQVRMAGYGLQAEAAAKKAQSEELKGTTHLLRQSLFQNEESLGIQHSALEERKEILATSKEQQDISESKVTKAGAEIPGVLENSKKLHEESEPMAEDVKEQKKEKEQAAAGSSDPDAAANEEETAGELDKTAKDSSSMNEQFSGIKQDAQKISDDLSPAAKNNSLSAADIAMTDEKLVQTEDKLNQIASHNDAVKAHTDQLLSLPDQMIKEANELDKLGTKKVKDSMKMENQLHTMQKGHLDRISSVKGTGFATGENETAVQQQPEDNGAIQMKPEDNSTMQRQTVDTTADNSQDQINSVDGQLLTEQENLEGQIISASGDLNVGERSLKGITDTLEVGWEDIAGIPWYQIGQSIDEGKAMLMNNPGEFFAQMFTNMGENIINYFAPPALLPGESYARWGFKYLTNMVTGLAMLFGTIALLCGLFLAVVGIISFWFLPSGIPFWPSMPGVTIMMETSGGYALLLAEIALAMRGVIFINDLVGMAMAYTAKKQQNYTRMMQENVSGVWAPLMIMLPAKFFQGMKGRFGGKKGGGPKTGETPAPKQTTPPVNQPLASGGPMKNMSGSLDDMALKAKTQPYSGQNNTLPTTTKPVPSSGAMKNASGSLDNAAYKARTQPLGSSKNSGKNHNLASTVENQTWQSYEAKIRNIYGETPFSSRQYNAIVNGERVNGVADNVAVINGKNVAVEAKFVKDWSKSIRNPNSPIGDKPFAIAEQQKMLSQAQKYSNAFDEVIYHTNSAELASYYTQLFNSAGILNL